MRVALVGGTVYPAPGQKPLADATVLLEGGTIAAIGGRELAHDATTVDCSGCTVTSGFWNAHVHFFERKWSDAERIPATELAAQLNDFTRFGFTHVFDLSSAWENTRRLKGRIASGEVLGPAILSTGEGLIPRNGLPPADVLRMMGMSSTPMPEVAEAPEAAAAANELLDANADAIKVFVSSQTGSVMEEAAIRAAVDAAHARGKPAFAHPNTGDDVLSALRAGVDVIAHTTPRTPRWSDGVLERIAERRPALTPTLALWKFFLRHDRLSVQEATVDAAVQQLRTWIGSGGEVLFGTDLGAVDPDPADEYALMARAGMDFDAILASLTAAPASRFGNGRSEGRIAAGCRADLVVIDGDPASDVRALTHVRHTIVNGKIAYGNGT